MSFFAVDIDGTLANCDHRLHHVSGGRKQWNAFFADMVSDTLYEETHEVMQALQKAGHTAIIVSARPDNYREITERWLADHNVRYTKLYMRKAEDFRKDSIVKKEILDQITAEWGKPWLAIDDRDQVCKMWKDNGVFVMRVNEREEAVNGSPNYYIMVGPSGAGKDHLISVDPVLRDCFSVSSDKLRAILCKDFKDQSRNTLVFQTAHRMIRASLENGMDTVFNATNIRTADRKAAVKIAPEGCKIHYVVVNRPIEQKLRDGGWRNEVAGLIERHDNTFKSNLKDIMRGDNLGVNVIDRRM